MSVKSVQFTVAAHIMAALAYHHGKEISSATLADSVNADPTFVRKSLSKLSKAGLVVTKRGKSGASVLARSPRRITLLDIYRASAGSFVSSRKEVSGQPQPQGVHGGGSFSSAVQLREIARENNAGQSDWADPGKGAVTFLISIVQIIRTINEGGLREW
jgi:DNA-binding IscR family transcriptional regulator